jgi:thioredoxin reductase (NADPH)
VELVTQAEVTSLEGRDGHLEAIRWRERNSGTEVRRSVGHLFLFIGADPNSDWLRGSGTTTDDKGFILTGAAAGSGEPFETSQLGIFAIGDVRSGSIKRVAAAVGEGAQVVAALHNYFAASDRKPAEALTRP